MFLRRMRSRQQNPAPGMTHQQETAKACRPPTADAFLVRRNAEARYLASTLQRPVPCCSESGGKSRKVGAEFFAAGAAEIGGRGAKKVVPGVSPPGSFATVAQYVDSDLAPARSAQTSCNRQLPSIRRTSCFFRPCLRAWRCRNWG